MAAIKEFLETTVIGGPTFLVPVILVVKRSQMDRKPPSPMPLVLLLLTSCPPS